MTKTGARRIAAAVATMAIVGCAAACTSPPSSHHASPPRSSSAPSALSPSSAPSVAPPTAITAQSTPAASSLGPASSHSPATPTAPSTTKVPPTTPAPSPAQPPPTTRPPAPTPTPTPTPAPLLVQQLHSVGDAKQVVIVTATSWSTDVATLQTFEQDAGTWHAVFPAMPAHIGRAGFSADKHEGDLKTPAGMFGFGTMFGQQPNPGVKFPYRQADSQSVWVDDVNSQYYNTWQENAALSGEHLASSGYATAYAYAVDIAYNTSPIVPGKGSAIFLHVSTGGGTAGCVSIAKANLLEVVRWLDPTKKPVIVMGPSSVIRQY